MPDLVTVDGSYGEGGGQIVRTSLSLAALLGVPVRIDNVRAGRKRPGLQAQHLTAVRMAAQICDAEVTGAELGSTTLHFAPRTRPTPGNYSLDVAQMRKGGSAGAVTLVLQTVLVPLARADGPSRITLYGGTHVAWSPPVHYITHVYLPTLARWGYRAEVHLDCWGWYPIGQGMLRATIQPHEPVPIAFEALAPGKDRRVWGLSAASNLPRHVVERQRRRALKLLKKAGLRAEIEEVADAPTRSQASKGSFVFLVAECEHGVAGFSALGARGKPAERVAEEAFRELRAWQRSGAALDSHLADQVILPLALAGGPATFTTSAVTQHLLTNAWAVEQFLPVHIAVEGKVGQPGRVRIAS
jgi:RNA 3'-terminal phosphate cyclase (ATP)